MSHLRFSINTENHTIELYNIHMNQDNFSYNSINFIRTNEDRVTVKYKKNTPENTRDGIDCNLTWALNDIIKVISEYSKPGFNYYNPDYKMFEFNL